MCVCVCMCQRLMECESKCLNCIILCPCVVLTEGCMWRGHGHGLCFIPLALPDQSSHYQTTGDSEHAIPYAGIKQREREAQREKERECVRGLKHFS